MSAPIAKTKMTRSNWSRSKRPNTKSKDLARSKNVTVMSRYGGKSLSRYATTYMSRDNAAVPSVDDVEIKPHDVDALVELDDVSQNDVSRESMGIKRERRLFDSTSDGLTSDELMKKVKLFDAAQAKGHTSIIQVVSFSHDYLVNQNVLSADYSGQKGLMARSLDDSKLRQAIRQSVLKMADQAGFSELEYIASIHGNTAHPHVHIAMIETDDNATGRLAARDLIDSDQLDDDSDKVFVGKSPAAVVYDKKYNVSNTVERGMMRQSEIDYFRQEIDNSLTNMSSLVVVRDLEYQQAYASSVNLDVMREAHHNDAFMKDFILVNKLLQKPFDDGSSLTNALDTRVEKMSRELLSGSDFGQKKFMQKQYQLGVKLSKENALKDAILVHSVDTPSDDDIADYKTMNLDPNKYTGIVLTPSEFADKNPNIDAQHHLDYADRYKLFIEKPELKNLDGLVLKNSKDMKIEGRVSKFMAHQDQMLVDMTKSSVYQMLMRSSELNVHGAELTDALGKTLRNIRPNLVENNEINGTKSFQQRLRRTGVRPELTSDRLSKILTTAESARQVDTLPSEIKSARDLLVETYDDSIKDLDAMMTVSSMKHVSKDQRKSLLEHSRNLREITLGEGDLTKAGTMLHAALSAEVANTGSIDRVHKLKFGERESLFTAYRETTVDKMSAITSAISDLNSGVSFSESSQQQALRTDLTDTLEDMSNGYNARLEYVDKIESISKMDNVTEQDELAQLMLSQAMWRQGIDEGATSKEIQQSIAETSDMSTSDKLATVMTLHLRELDAAIEQATSLAETKSDMMKVYYDEYDTKTFNATKVLNDHIVHNRLNSFEDSYDASRNSTDVDNTDIIYDPAKYAFVVNNKPILERTETAQTMTYSAEMALDVILQKKNVSDYMTLEAERLASQRASDEDLSVVDNHIKMTYDNNIENELYVAQQDLSNVSDETLRHDIESLNEYDETKTVKQVVKLDHSDELVSERVVERHEDKDIERVVTREPVADNSPKRNVRKGTDITR